MKFKKSISRLVILIAVLSIAASVYGVFSSQGKGQFDFKTIHDTTVTIYGRGLYQNDSVSVASQAVAQDIVTLFLGVPLLLVSLYLFRQGLLKGKLLLAGTIAYFLYTYTSYSFLSMFNQFFLIDVMLMSASFFAFVLTMMSFDIDKLSDHFSEKLPVKFVGGLLISIGTIFGLMWLGTVVPSIMSGTAPTVMEHYTTLVIQAMDLAFVVPTAFLAGILLIKRKPFGYLLSSVVTVKGITMLTALTAMVINEMLAGVEVSIAILILIPVLNLIIIYSLYLIMKNIKETKNAVVVNQIE